MILQSVEVLVEVKLVPISGICFGLEWLWNVNILVVDVGFIRFYMKVNTKNV